MHQALVALQPELRPEERSLAFLDDLYLTAQPDRIQPLFQAACRCLYERARISLNHAKTRVWNAAAVEPPGLADISTADVWRGNAQLPEAEQGITVLGAPLGGNAFVRAQLNAVRSKQLRLLQVLPTLPDLQVAWLLLFYCASPRSNYALRIIPPELTDLFAIEHDAAVQRCFSAVLFAELPLACRSPAGCWAAAAGAAARSFTASACARGSAGAARYCPAAATSRAAPRSPRAKLLAQPQECARRPKQNTDDCSGRDPEACCNTPATACSAAVSRRSNAAAAW